MFYKFIYYKYYQWISESIDPFAPQITSLLMISLLPLSTIYSFIRVIHTLHISQIKIGYTTNPIIIVLIVLFIILFIFNQIYFFVINNWKELILFFRENEISRKKKIVAYIIIIYSTIVYAVFFIFLGFNF
jgi:hypothetical protein